MVSLNFTKNMIKETNKKSIPLLCILHIAVSYRTYFGVYRNFLQLWQACYNYGNLFFRCGRTVTLVYSVLIFLLTIFNLFLS